MNSLILTLTRGISRSRISFALFLMLLVPAWLTAQTPFFSYDFESDTLGDPPAGWVLDDPNDGNTADNGAAIIDATSTEATPIVGQSLYIYDKVDSENTWLKQDFAGGQNVSAVHLHTYFARAFEDADENVRVHLALGRAGDRLNNSDFRMFEIRIQNNGDLRVNHNPTQGPGDDDSTETAGSFGDGPQTLDVFANSHDSEAVDYDVDGLSGSLEPNTMDVYLNGVQTGTYFFLQTPDPANSPEINFAASDTDFGQIGLYQDTGRTGGIVFDNMTLTELEVAEPSSGNTIFSADFEGDTPGEQPSGDWSFSPSDNEPDNGAYVVDGTTDPVNPLAGNGFYVYDSTGDENTHIRTTLNGGVPISAARLGMTFQRAFASAEDDSDTGIKLTLGTADMGLTNSDNRLFEFRILNNGDMRVEYSRDGAGGDRGSTNVGSYDVDNPNELAMFVNSHGTETVDYDDGTLSGSLAPNMLDLYVNGNYIGSYLTLKTPDPDNAPQVDFWASDADLSQLSLYQDTSRQGGIVFDDILITELEIPEEPSATLFAADFEGDTPGEQPSGDWTFSPGSNDGTNGAVVVDGSTTPANPLPGQSLYVYDLNGDGSSGESTNVRTDFLGGDNVSAARVSFDFQPMYTVGDDDDDTRVHFTIGQAGLSMNNSDFRLFEIRMQNNGGFRVEYSRDGAGGDRGSSEVGSFDPTQPGEVVIFINTHGTESVSYDDGTNTGTLDPNMMDVFLNGNYIGTYLTLKTPDPSNAPEIDFWSSDADLGQIAFYQDSKRQGGVVFDNILVTELEIAEPAPIVFENDFESDTPGEQPAGDWTFSPGSNDATNGAVVVDGTTTPANPLPGQALYVYDLNGDGSSGESTNIRTDFLGGDNISAARVSFDFQPMYTVGDDDDDTRVHFTIGQAGLSMNNSDFRLFEIRMQNNGGFRVEYSRDGAGGDRGSSEVGSFDPTQPGEVVIFINTHGTESVNYDDGTNAGTLDPNMMDVYLNDGYIGTYLTLKTPDPDNAPEIDFWSSDADLGQIAFYQDSKRQGGAVFDNIVVQQLSTGDGGGGGGDELQVYIDLFDFEDETVGEQPVMPFPTAFSPSSNTADNGFVVIDDASDPANPMGTGQALYVYDMVTNAPSHMRFDFDSDNTDNVRVDLDFQRAYETPAEDEDSRIHVAVAPAGTSTNNSDFRPFEIRILNNGSLVVNYNPTGAELEGRDSETVAQYETTGVNHLTFFANGNNADALPYDDEELGSGDVPANSMVLFLNGTKIGEYGFLNTPDPGAAPQIQFFETTDELGRFGIYQDTSRPGGIFIDNLSIRNFAQLGAPDAPSGLTATSTGPQSINLEWTDNANNETGFIIEMQDGASWMEIGTADVDATSFEVTGLEPETEYAFRVLSTNGTPSAPSNEATATTDVQLLPIISVQPADQLNPSGSSVVLSVEATGPAPLSYQWYEGTSGDTGTPVSGATSSTFTTPILSATTTFWVRVSNDNGSDDSVAATVEVFEPRVIRVVSLDQLEALLPDALPGDTYVLDAGTYPDAQIRFEAMGTENAPITLMAEFPGEVIFTGDSYLEVGGEWLVVEGFLWTDGWNESLDQVITFRAGSSQPARNCRVTQCAIVDFSPPDPSVDRDWIGMYGSDNRFDHNYIAGHSNKGVTLVVWRSNNVEDRHLIDNNHFAFRASGGGENGWETIRIGTSGDSLSSSKTVVEYNLFEECNGEVEIISNKSGENVYRYNTFLRCDGMLTLRHGNDCIVEGNVFLGEGVSGSGGIRVIGENHTIINNYIEGTTGRQGGAIAVYAGVENSPLNEYFVADGTFVGNNTIVDVIGAHVLIGAGFGSSDRTVLPTGVVVTNNLFAQAFTSGSSTDGPAITGEAVSGQLYAGNITSGVALGDAPSGVVSVSVGFDEGEFGLLRPAAGSAIVDAADAAYPVALDLDGQERGVNQDVGADELSDAPGINIGGPLTADEVGPSWLDRTQSQLPWIGDGILPGDQVISPWFGSFTVSTDDWLYHGELSWIYVGFVESTDAMWIWSHYLQSWLWSSEELFPIVYDAGAGAWRIYVILEDGGAFMFDFTTQQWTAIP